MKMNVNPVSVKRILFVVAVLVGSIEFIRYQLASRIYPSGSVFHSYFIPIITGIILAVGNYFILNKLLKKYIEQQAKLKQVESLYKLGIELGSFKDVGSNLQIAVERVRNLLKVDFAGLAIYNSQKNEIRWRFVSGNKTGKYKRIRTRKGEGLAGICVAQKTLVEVIEYPTNIPFSEDPEAMPLMKVEKLVSGVTVPLTYEEQVYGALLVAHRKPYKFTDDEIFILYGIANQLGVLLEHSRLYQEIESLATVMERERLAREIHDGIAQTICYVQLQLKKLQKLVQERNNFEAEEIAIMEDILKAVDRSYSEVRDSIHGLKDKELFSKGFKHWLEAYAKSYQDQFGIPVEVEFLDQTTNELSEIAKIQLGRIIQEALTNTRKHAQATQVKISVGSEEDNYWIIEIYDNGIGFELQESPEGHYGLTIMKERAQSISGTLKIDSEIGKGTKITIKIPNEENERREFSWI